jgi:hypothetical protein
MRLTMRVALLAAVAAVAACNKSDPVDPTIPAKMLMVDGEPQTGAAGADAVAPLRVRIVNLAGDPVAGIPVDWEVTQGGGTVSNPHQQTSSEGISSVTFTYGTAGAQVITATYPGLTGSPQTFHLTATPVSGGGGGGL